MGLISATIMKKDVLFKPIIIPKEYSLSEIFLHSDKGIMMFEKKKRGKK